MPASLSLFFWRVEIKKATINSKVGFKEVINMVISGLLMGIITLVFGVIVMIFPKILNYLIGIYLIIVGVIAIIQAIK